VGYEDPEWRKERARLAAHARWARSSGHGQNVKLREAKLAKWRQEIDPDGTMPSRTLAKRLKHREAEAMARARMAKDGTT
jgi:hypothetical protein